MRLLVVLTVLMLCIIGLGFFVEHGVYQIVERMLVSLDQGEQLVDSGKLSEGLTVFRDVYQQWKAAQDTWNPFVYNTDLEEVEVVLARLITYVETHNLSHMKAELGHVRTRLKQIQSQERLILKNIL